MNTKTKEVQDKNKEPKHKSEAIKKPKSFTAILLAASFILSLAIIAAIIFISSTSLQKFEQQETLLKKQKLQIQQLLSKQKRVNQDIQEQLNTNTLNQNKELTTLKETISAFLKQNQHTRRDWLVAESEYLVKLANHRLLLSHDITTSIQALLSADDRLREIGNPKYIPLRRALRLNIQQLNAVPKIDTVGISAAINALQKQVETLPLHTPVPETIKQGDDEPLATAQISDWKKFPYALWNDLLALIRIQHHNDAIQPLLSPEQRFFLLQNLKLQLEQARSALLNNYPSLYKDRLEQAQAWVIQYFDAQHPLVKAFNSEISTLIKTNITLKLPTISESLSKLHLLRSQSKSPIKLKPKPKAKKTPPKKTKIKNQPPTQKNKQTTPSKPSKSESKQNIIDPIQTKKEQITPQQVKKQPATKEHNSATPATIK